MPGADGDGHAGARWAMTKMPQPREDDVPDSWSTLMAAAQSGDQAAYARLLGELVPYLRVLARRHLRAAADIEDAVQDILLTVHAIRHTYDPGRPFQPWIATIARRRVVDRVRVRIRTTGRETMIDLAPETSVAIPPNVEKTEDARALRRAMDQLTPGQRQAVQLLKLEELSLKEASAKSGMTIPALKVAMHRALKALRRAMGGE
jgi:RNA polymerase sigma-70 factor (ECF subfamily)